MSGPGGYTGPDRDRQVILHTTWGGRVNRPVALALEAAWRERFGSRAEVHADNDAIVVQVKDEIDPAVLLSLVTPANFEALLRRSLEGSGFFGARFRECAGRSLLLTKRRFNERMPLWMTRLQAKKLMTATRSLTDFPVMLETWRTCLKDEFDLVAAYEALERLAAGEMSWSVATVPVPSPFAASIAFNQVSRYMYADDRPEQGGSSALSDGLIRRAVFDQSLRPAIDPAVIGDLESRLQRRRDGYVPEGDDELVEWVKERVAIPEQEWFEGVDVPTGLNRIVHADRTYIVHPEIEIGADPVRDVAELLQFYGPRPASDLADLLPVDNIAPILDELTDGEILVRGALVAGSEAEYFCDAENLETLIRFQRAANRPGFEPRPVADLAPFLAEWQGFGGECTDDRILEAADRILEAADRILEAADRLRGYVAPVAFWLDEAFQARLAGAGASDLETATASGGLAWRGSGREAVRVGFADDFDVLGTDDPGGNGTGIVALFKDPLARYTFGQLREESGLDAESFNDAFWEAVWSGTVAADGFAALAAGRSRRFRLHEPGSAPVREPNRRTRSRMRAAAMGWPGTWYQVPAPALEAHGIERLEERKERCRFLFERYGVVTREHANREGGALRWSALFPALRLMELSGEIVAGLFFTELSGPQFALPEAIRHLERLNKAAATFWISAVDPVAPSGLGVALRDVPHRRIDNHLGYYEGKLAIASENFGRRLAIRLDPDDPGLDALLPNLAIVCRRRRRLTTETINGEPARGSPYLPALSRHLAVVTDHKGIYFESRAP